MILKKISIGLPIFILCIVLTACLSHEQISAISDTNDMEIQKEENEKSSTVVDAEARESDANMADGHREEKDGVIVYFQKSMGYNMPAFTFRVLFNQGLIAAPFEYYENIPPTNRIWMEKITILDEDGYIVQELEGFDPVFWRELPSIDSEQWWMSPAHKYFYGIGFADYNFDGFLDLVIPRHGYERNTLRFAFGNFHHFLWDNDIGQFVLNEQLIELERYDFFRAEEDFRTTKDILEPGNSVISLNGESQLLEFTSFLSGNWSWYPPLEQFIANWTITQHYQYTNGEFTLIRIQEKLYDWEGTWRVRTLDKTTNTETITYIESGN